MNDDDAWKLGDFEACVVETAIGYYHAVNSTLAHPFTWERSGVREMYFTEYVYCKIENEYVVYSTLVEHYYIPAKHCVVRLYDDGEWTPAMVFVENNSAFHTIQTTDTE